MSEYVCSETSCQWRRTNIIHTRNGKESHKRYKIEFQPPLIVKRERKRMSFQINSHVCTFYSTPADRQLNDGDGDHDEALRAVPP